MQFIEYPSRDTWKELLKRPSFDVTSLFSIVGGVIDQVKKEGDKALRELELKFDKVSLDSLIVSEQEFNAAEQLSLTR